MAQRAFQKAYLEGFRKPLIVSKGQNHPRSDEVVGLELSQIHPTEIKSDSEGSGTVDLK